MDISEFRYQVGRLLSILSSPGNNFLGQEYTLLPDKNNLIEQLICEHSFSLDNPNLQDSRFYKTKLMATPSPNTTARITMPLVDRLATLKMDGPGARVGHQGVEWWFVVEDAERKSPSYSSSDEDDDHYDADHDADEEEQDDGEDEYDKYDQESEDSLG